MIKIAHVIQATSEITGISIPLLLSPCRRSEIAQARMMAAAVAREVTGKSYWQIGQKLRRKDHTTIMYSVRVTAERVKANELAAATREQIIARAKELADGFGRIAPASVMAVIPELPPDGRRKPAIDFSGGWHGGVPQDAKHTV